MECNDIAMMVFEFLEAHELAYAAMVCRRWNVLANQDILWKRHVLELVNGCSSQYPRTAVEVEKARREGQSWQWIFHNVVWDGVHSLTLPFIRDVNLTTGKVRLSAKIEGHCRHVINMPLNNPRRDEYTYRRALQVHKRNGGTKTTRCRLHRERSWWGGISL